MGGSGALFNFTLTDILNASVTARAYLEGIDTFLVEEAIAVEKGGDKTMAQMWKMAGGGLRMVLQVRTVRTVRTAADALERRADVRVVVLLMMMTTMMATAAARISLLLTCSAVRTRASIRRRCTSAARLPRPLLRPHSVR